MRFVKGQFWMGKTNPKHIAEVLDTRGDGHEGYVQAKGEDGHSINGAGEWANFHIFAQHWTLVTST